MYETRSNNISPVLLYSVQSPFTYETKQVPSSRRRLRLGFSYFQKFTTQPAGTGADTQPHSYVDLRLHNKHYVTQDSQTRYSYGALNDATHRGVELASSRHRSERGPTLRGRRYESYTQVSPDQQTGPQPAFVPPLGYVSLCLFMMAHHARVHPAEPP